MSLSPWVPISSSHRSTILQMLEEHAGGISISEATMIGLESYQSGLSAHLHKLSDCFSVQFNSETYRRASGVEIQCTENRRVSAVAVADGLHGRVTVSSGLMYALEDLWQCVVSDNNTDLHVHGGTPANGLNNVLRNVDMFHTYDRQRFFDYSHTETLRDEIVAHILTEYPGQSKEKVSNDTRYFHAQLLSNALIKMVSQDPRRVVLGYHLADLSLQWIIAHEDAHIYNGHTAAFQKCGMAASELGLDRIDKDFLEYNRSHMRPKLAGYDYATVRELSELHADFCACTRMVDMFFDQNAFVIYPLWNEGVRNIAKKISDETNHFIPEEQLHTLQLARMCITSAIGAVLLFQRTIEKHDVRSNDYPDIGTRITNIIVTTMRRIYDRTNIPFEPSRHFFQIPDQLTRTVLAIGLSEDIKVMTWNLLRHPSLLQDPDLPANKSLQLTKHLKTISDNSVQLQIVAEALELSVLTCRESVNMKDMIALHAVSDGVTAMSKLESQYYNVFSEVFKSDNYIASSAAHEKLADSQKILKSRGEVLVDVLKMATLVRQRMNQQVGQ